MPTIKEFLNSKLHGTDLSYAMTWGKFKGKSIIWIIHKNSVHIDLLLMNKFVNPKCPKLKEDLLKLRRSHCGVVAKEMGANESTLNTSVYQQL